MESNIDTRFLIISDTHNLNFGDVEKVFKHPLPKADVLLHCGDLTSVGGVESYKALLELLGAIDAELKLVIAGNHDLDLDKTYFETHFDKDNDGVDGHKKAVEVMTGPLAKAAGVTYLEEGLHTFTLKNRATFTIYTSPYTPEFFDWGFAYKSDDDRFNLPQHIPLDFNFIGENTVPDFPGVDIMMTHGPPQFILDRNAKGENVGCKALSVATRRARPLLHCFGHIHEAYGMKEITWKDDGGFFTEDSIETQMTMPNVYPEPSNWPIRVGKQTLMVNASIMNAEYKPTNAPWLVELNLRREPKPDM
ncbi:Metallo-dependent phosphatase [Hyaloscypha variabilis]